MNKLEPIEKPTSMPEVIKAVAVNQSINIHADRLASFKSSVSRLGGFKFTYGSAIDNYIKATRTA